MSTETKMKSEEVQLGREAKLAVQRLTTIVAVILVGLSAGFFYTYEISVTHGLAIVDDLTYVATFQAINETVTNGWFGIMFFGSIPAIVLALAVGRRGARTTTTLNVVALLLYLTGFAITAAGNVPLNDQLALVTELTADSAAAARLAFEDDWNRLNLLRTVAIGASFVAITLAAAYQPRGIASRWRT